MKGFWVERSETREPFEKRANYPTVFSPRNKAGTFTAERPFRSAAVVYLVFFLASSYAELLIHHLHFFARHKQLRIPSGSAFAFLFRCLFFQSQPLGGVYHARTAPRIAFSQQILVHSAPPVTRLFLVKRVLYLLYATSGDCADGVTFPAWIAISRHTSYTTVSALTGSLRIFSLFCFFRALLPALPPSAFFLLLVLLYFL